MYRPSERGGGVNVAMRFVRAVRGDTSLAARVRAVDPADGLDPVVRVAAEAGFELSAEDLRMAHAYDWALRRVRYSNGGTTAR
jgi:predicted ribosomally synthesized peptide with nif11-like leader